MSQAASTHATSFTILHQRHANENLRKPLVCANLLRGFDFTAGYSPILMRFHSPSSPWSEIEVSDFKMGGIVHFSGMISRWTFLVSNPSFFVFSVYSLHLQCILQTHASQVLCRRKNRTHYLNHRPSLPQPLLAPQPVPLRPPRRSVKDGLPLPHSLQFHLDHPLQHSCLQLPSNTNHRLPCPSLTSSFRLSGPS